MLRWAKTSRAYDPETIAIMTMAFNKVCQSISAPMNDDEYVKRTSAQAILQLVDQGQRDPQAIAMTVLDQLTGGRRAAE
jgi:hypothetical protein